MKANMLLPMILLVAVPAMSTAQMSVVDAGEAVAVVVTAVEPQPVAEYAVGELVQHVQKASGITLPVATEAAVPANYANRIYVGGTEAARRQGIRVKDLPPETFVMRCVGSELYILGDEDNANPLDPANIKSGTLFGVYEFLDRFVGVRWLWPGELGTYIPRTRRIAVPVLDETISPPLKFRNMRWHNIRNLGVTQRGKYDPKVARLAFTPEGIRNYGRDLEAYLRRHRMGGTVFKPAVGHYFGGW